MRRNGTVAIYRGRDPHPKHSACTSRSGSAEWCATESRVRYRHTHDVLLNRETLEAIAAGRISLVFRKWKRPTVKAGGTLLTAMGLLEIVAVDRVDPDDLSARDSSSAGFGDLASLLAFLGKRSEGEVYRVRVGALRADPRKALRKTVAVGSELEAVLARLEQLDGRSSAGPWTRRVLTLIAEQPEVRAADLAAQVGQDRLTFKRNVRRLKALGLTESLSVGYRLSRRGAAVMSAWAEPSGGSEDSEARKGVQAAIGRRGDTDRSSSA